MSIALSSNTSSSVGHMQAVRHVESASRLDQVAALASAPSVKKNIDSVSAVVKINPAANEMARPGRSASFGIEHGRSSIDMKSFAGANSSSLGVRAALKAYGAVSSA